MHSRAKQLRRLALPLIAGLTMLLTTVFAGPAKADPINNGIIAFNGGSNGDLWYYDSVGGHDSGLGMMAFTSPAITFGPNLVEVAFQANTEDLFAYFPQTNSHIDSGQLMSVTTSPSIAADDLRVAWVNGHNQHLMYGNIGSSSYDTGQWVSSNTSPSISADGNEIAYMGTGGHLWVYSAQFNQAIDTGLGMKDETSPAIGLDNGWPNNSGSQYMVAFQDNQGHLWYYYTGYTGNNDAGSGAHNTGFGMDSTSSPTIDPAWSNEMAFEANTGLLWTYLPSTNQAVQTGLGLSDPGAQPSLGPYYTSAGGFKGLQVAFSAKTNQYLYTYTTKYNNGDGSSYNTGLTLGYATSPSYTSGVEFPSCCGGINQ